MFRKSWRSILVAGALPLALAVLFAQEDTGTVFRSDARLVVCHTTVVDKSGHLVMSLPQQAFTVSENGVKQQIRVFKREDIPVSMGLVIDNSGSMRSTRTKVEAAAVALVKDSNPDDEVFVVNFNDTAYLDLPQGKEFTNQIHEMEDALRRIDSRGGTALWDAVQMSIDHLKKAHKDKKVLVVVTDGVNNASDTTLETVLRSARQSGTVVYCVGLRGEDMEKRDVARARHELNLVAEATGGETFFPTDVSEVDRIAHQVARDIRSQYVISYSPSNAAMDGTFRKIKVDVNAPGHPVARTRTGYYATPDQSKAASR